MNAALAAEGSGSLQPVLFLGPLRPLKAHTFPGAVSADLLEMEPQFRRQRTRRYIVRTAKGRQEVVKCGLVRHIHPRHLQTPLISIAIEQVVVPDRYIK